MLRNARHSLKKLALTTAAAFAISVFASSASANALYYLGDGIVLSCGSSAGNYFIDVYAGVAVYGGYAQFLADTLCEG